MTSKPVAVVPYWYYSTRQTQPHLSKQGEGLTGGEEVEGVKQEGSRNVKVDHGKGKSEVSIVAEGAGHACVGVWSVCMCNFTHEWFLL